MADLPHALTLVALTAAALQYALLMRHREERRNADRWQAELQDSLRFAHRLDPPRPVRRWKDSTHFQLDR